MYEIQVLHRGQWQNALVSDHSEDNRFATVAGAEAAMKDLIDSGVTGWFFPWRVAEVVED